MKSVLTNESEKFYREKSAVQIRGTLETQLFITLHEQGESAIVPLKSNIVV